MGDEHARSCTGGHLTLRYGSAQGSAGATISGEGCTESTWTFNPDTIIAYEASYIQTTNMASVPPQGRVRDVAVDWIGPDEVFWPAFRQGARTQRVYSFASCVA